MRRAPPPRLGKQHQREQPERFGLVRHQRGDKPAEPDALLGEIAAARLGAGGIGPAFGESRVDRRQHGVETLAQFGTLRHTKRHAGLTDLVFRARKPLAHRGGRNQKRRRDGGGIETEDRLQDQRRADAGIDCRMRAGKHQREALVGNVARGGGFQFFGHEPHLRCVVLAALPPPRRVDRLAARNGDEPGLGIVRNAVLGQSASAAANASDSASSAAATSRVRAESQATSLP